METWKSLHETFSVESLCSDRVFYTFANADIGSL